MPLVFTVSKAYPVRRRIIQKTPPVVSRRSNKLRMFKNMPAVKKMSCGCGK